MIKTIAIITAAGVVVMIIGPAIFERLAPRKGVRGYQRANMPLYRPIAGLVPGWAVIEGPG